MVSVVVEMARKTKILMSIIYKDAFDKLGMDIRKLHAS